MFFIRPKHPCAFFLFFTELLIRIFQFFVFKQDSQSSKMQIEAGTLQLLRNGIENIRFIVCCSNFSRWEVKAKAEMMIDVHRNSLFPCRTVNVKLEDLLHAPWALAKYRHS